MQTVQTERESSGWHISRAFRPLSTSRRRVQESPTAQNLLGLAFGDTGNKSRATTLLELRGSTWERC